MLPTSDVLAWTNEHAGKVEIHRFVAVGMGDLHHVAFAAFASGKDHATRADGLHPGADERAIVRAEMSAINLQNGIKAAVAKVRGHRRAEFQRRPEKHLLERLAVGVVVARLSGRIMVRKGLILLARVDLPLSKISIGSFLAGIRNDSEASGRH